MNFYWILTGTAIFMIALSLFFLILVRRTKNDSLIPSGKIVYDDLHGPSFSLHSKKYPLAGRPDLILKKGWKYIPVEVKTSNHHEPRPHHVIQIIAYCQLITDHFEKSSPYGYLIYSDTGKRFKIQFKHAEKKQLKQTIHQMNEMLQTGNIIRNHDNKQKCSGCILRSKCQKRVR